MEQKQYLIGELADSCGLSRDTIRYYEKRGLIHPKKGTNQYRYYSMEDFERLIALTWQRRMEIGLDDMEKLSECRTDYVNLLADITEEQIRREHQQIFRARQNLARLRQQQADCADVQRYLNQIRFRNFYGARVIVEETDCRNDAQVYLQYSRRYSGLDMMYACDEYRLTGAGNTCRADYQKTSWVLFDHLTEYVEYPLSKTRHLAPFPSLCLVVSSRKRIPDSSCLSLLLAEAERRKLTHAETIYISPMIYHAAPEQICFYFRIYLPVSEAAKGPETL